MTDLITITGVVATTPRFVSNADGLKVTSFRLASQLGRFDRERGAWVDLGTNWYTVTAFRRLAEHAAASLEKGDRVIVQGRLRIRSWESGDRSGTTVEIDADAIGHDLMWGTSQFTRASRAGGAPGGLGAAGESQAEWAPSSAPAPEGAGVADAEGELVSAVQPPF